MEEVDEGEAHALASKWVKNIAAKVGLTNVTGCNSGKQVHSNDDDIDKSDHKCGDASKKDESVNALHSLNCNDFILNSSQICENIVNHGDVGSPRAVLEPRLDKKYDSGLFSELVLDAKHTSVLEATNPALNAAVRETGIMRSLQKSPASNDELYDIWDFDEQQKQKAECYLKGTGIVLTTEKENIPVINEGFADNTGNLKFEQHSSEAESVLLEKLKSDGLSGSDVNRNNYKICPDCKEYNSLLANWCEECGKALISVKVTNLKTNQDSNKCASTKDSGEEKVERETAFTSKLNPNCAEFVSAYTMPQRKVCSQAPNDHLSTFEKSQSPVLSPADRTSYHIGKSSKNKYCSRSHKWDCDNKRFDDFKSHSFTNSVNVNQRRDRQNRSRRKPCGANSFGGVSEQLSYSYSPRNEQFDSPVNSFLGYGNFDAKIVPHYPTSPHVYGTLMVPGQYEFGTVPHANMHIDHRVPSQNLGEARGDNSISGFDQEGCFQGFDFENPPLDNPHLFGSSKDFDESEFSRSFVENALHQQIDYMYGPSNQQQQIHLSYESDFALAQPTFFCLQSYHPAPDLPYHRAYRKKKIVENGIESPSFARNLSRDSKHSQQATRDSYKVKDESPTKQKHVDNGSKTNKLHDESGFSPEVKVPPLKLDDLENYDQVLTLIRTSRGEAVPYLCLPEEIILYIFSYLTTADLCQCARVCHQFYRISVDESLWKEITIKKHKGLSDEILMQIAKKSPISLTITQCQSKKVTEQGMRRFFQSCGENLVDLDFSACSGSAFVGELILLHVSTRCRNLRSLDISWSNVSDIGIQAVSEALTRLECLCMNGCQAITDESTRCIANRHSESIRVLEMFGCFNITQASMTILRDCCPNIETLNIGQCHKVSDNAVSDFVRKAKRLENIDLRGCKQIKDNAILMLASSCPNLSTLVTANCPLITDASLIAIASRLPNIRCIDVCGCPKITDKGIQALAKACGKLQMLDLSSTKASNKAVMSLANYCFKTLEILKMSFCHKITEISLEHLARKCTRLKLLHLYGCKSIRNLKRVQNCRGTLTIET